MAEKKKIKLTINGKNYMLVHDESDEYMHELEAYVNHKIREAARAGIRLGEPTSYVMASISIADEMMKLKAENAQLKKMLGK